MSEGKGEGREGEAQKRIIIKTRKNEIKNKKKHETRKNKKKKQKKEMSATENPLAGQWCMSATSVDLNTNDPSFIRLKRPKERSIISPIRIIVR